MSQALFLFRFDGAQANHDFAELWQRRHGSVLYAGATMKVGPGWTPDFAEVAVDETAMKVQITLIELEATDIVARESCRKYLPESSFAIIKVFSQYLDNVLKRCQSTADQRFETFQSLKEFLSRHPAIVVRTAAALRNSPDLLEVFPLIDRPQGSPAEGMPVESIDRPSFACEGERSLSRGEVEGLLRVVRILHAIRVGRDHNNGTLDSSGRQL